ncbi:MAG: NUDIX domain-containing protein [Planctomycetota bacterium]|nr:MAG: NUDIX domain-containing protein [Planctomycetota bacterium]
MADLAPHQQRLAAALRAYHGVDETEEEHRRRILAAVEADPAFWHRETLPGHVTGSAFVAAPALDALLLVHHRRLDRWLQPGGHDEGERDPARTALREVGEETGLRAYAFFGAPALFDLDVHRIPAAGAMPAHDHLDVRFLLVADPSQELRPDPREARTARWFPLAAAAAALGEEGGLRAVRKIEEIRAQASSK